MEQFNIKICSYQVKIPEGKQLYTRNKLPS